MTPTNLSPCYSCTFSGGDTGTTLYTWTCDSADMLVSDHPAVIALCDGCAAYCQTVDVILTETDDNTN